MENPARIHTRTHSARKRRSENFSSRRISTLFRAGRSRRFRFMAPDRGRVKRGGCAVNASSELPPASMLLIGNEDLERKVCNSPSKMFRKERCSFFIAFFLTSRARLEKNILFQINYFFKSSTNVSFILNQNNSGKDPRV